MVMHNRLAIMAGVVGLFALSGCGTAATAPTNAASGATLPIATAPPAPTAATAAPVTTLACRALALGTQGHWSSAETAWLAAENGPSTDANGALAYFKLLTDTASVAIDQATSTSMANDVETYKADLVTDAQYVVGC